jgi:hypothetical protein
MIRALRMKSRICQALDKTSIGIESSSAAGSLPTNCMGRLERFFHLDAALIQRPLLKGTFTGATKA